MSKRRELHDYEVRTGPDGKAGIYLRNYNMRLATFVANSRSLQAALKGVFDGARRKEKR